MKQHLPPQKNNKQHNNFQYIVLYNPKYFNSIHFLWKYIQWHREEGQEVPNILRIALRAENMTRNELGNSRYFSNLFCYINVSLWRYSLYICVFTVKCMFKYFAMLGLHFVKLQVGLWTILKLFKFFQLSHSLMTSKDDTQWSVLTRTGRGWFGCTLS